jgi:hypothetical protein
VVNGYVDGLTAARIREKYPHFSAFAYKPFQSGLNGISPLTRTRAKESLELTKKKKQKTEHDVAGKKRVRGSAASTSSRKSTSSKTISTVKS